MPLGPFLRNTLALLAALALPTALAAQATAPAVTLPATALGATSTATVTFTFSASTTVASVNVVTQGTPLLDFQPGTQATSGACAPGTYAANATCTEAVKFTPLAPGLRLGAVNLADSSGNLLATGFVGGRGLGGQFTAPSPLTTVSLQGAPGTVGGATRDAAGNLFFVGTAGVTKITPAGVVTSCTCGLLVNPSYLSLESIAIDGSGQIFVTGFYYDQTSGNDYGDFFLVNLAAGTSSRQSASFGLATQGSQPADALTIDGSGNFFLSQEGGSDPILELLRASQTTSTLASNSSVAPWQVGFDSVGNVYFASDNRTPYAIVNGTETPFSGLSNPHGLVVTPDDNLIVQSGSSLYTVAAGTAAVATIATGGSTSTPFNITLDSAGNVLYPGGNSSSILQQATRTAPSATISSPTALNSTSPEQTITVTNTGSAAAALAAFTATGPVALGPSTTCSPSTSVAVGGTCVVGYVFKPTQHGPSPQTGVLTSTSTASGTFSLTISGNVAGDPTKVVFTPAPPSTLVAGGSAGTVTATLQDSTGNTAINANTQPITLTVTYPGGTTITYGPTNAVDGVASFNTSGHPLTQSGTYTYTASSPSLTSALATETVTGVTAASITVTAAGTATASVPLNVTFTTYDQYGNLAAASSDTFTYTSTDSTATLPAAFAPGTSTAVKPVTFNRGGTFTVTVTDTTSSSVSPGTSGNVVVAAIPVFVVQSSLDPTTGSAGNCPDQSAQPVGTTSAGNSACTLRDAIAAVNATTYTGLTGPQPLINFVPAVTSVVLTNGVLVPTHNFRLAGNGPTSTAISGNGTQQIFKLATAALHLSFQGVTLKSGLIAANGGAFANTAASTVDFVNDVLSGNQAALGGAIYTSSGTLNISSTSFNSNTALSATTAVAGGGAIYAITPAVVNISNSTFSSNTASYTDASAATAEGGAFYFSGTGTLQIASSSFTGNLARSTAGIAYGGAIFLTGASGANNTIKNTLIAGNQATGNTTVNGGGLYLTSSVLTLTGSTLTGNAAATSGGGIYRLGTSSFNSYSNTITGNSSATGGGLSLASNSGYIFDNTVIAGNTASVSYNDLNQTPPTTSHNNVINSAQPVATTLQPLLTALGSFGGPTLGAGTFTAPLQTMIPLPGSPLLGAGSAAYINPAITAGPTTDARGLPRSISYQGTSFVDAGATQSNYTLAFTQQPTSTQINTAFSPIPTLLLTESGQPFNATPYNAATPGTLTLTPASGTLANPTVTLPSSTAAATFQSSSTFAQPQTNDSITATVTSGTSILASATSSLFNITDNSAASIGFNQPPPFSLMAGSNAGTVKVALLTSGHVDTNSSAQVTLAVSGTASNTFGPVAAVNGIATFNLSGTPLAAGSYTYTASSPYTSDTVSAPETVTAPTLGSLSLSGIASAVATGRPQSLVVTALDQSGNLLTTFTGTVSITSTDPLAVLSPTSYTFTASDAGAHTFLVTPGTAGPQTVTATTGSISATLSTATTGYISIVDSNGAISRLFGDGSVFGNYTGTGSLGGAIDAAGDVWTLSGNTLSEFSRTGFNLSSPNFSGGGLNNPVADAIDGAGQIWIANSTGNSISAFSNSGIALSPATTGYTGPYSNPSALAIDLSGNVWVANQTNNSITEILGAATPVTPLTQGVTNASTATKP